MGPVTDPVTGEAQPGGPARSSRRAFIRGSGLAAALCGAGALRAVAAAPATGTGAVHKALQAGPGPHAEIGYLSAAELTAAYRSGALSPVEVLKALYERMDALNPLLKAFIPGDPAIPLRDAQASQERWRRNEPLGPLDGVPVSAKHHINVRGLVTTQSRPPAARLNKIAQADDPVVDSLKSGGVIVFAKTTSPESAISHSGVSTLHGNAPNPWNLTRTSGGSSTGAGIAAAAGIGPLHVGSDGGGSIRGPSAYCGVYGLKSTPYRVAQPNYWNGWSNFGPIARDPLDSAQLMGLLTRASSRVPDQVVRPWRDEPITGVVAELKGARIGFCPWVGDIAPKMSEEPAKATEEVVALLAACGTRIESVGPFVPDDFWRSAIYGRVVVPMLRGMGNTLPRDEIEALSPWHQEMLKRSREVPESVSAEEDARFLRIREKLVNPLETFDYLVVQQFCGPTQSVDRPWPDYGTLDQRIAFSYDYVLPLWIFNYLGVPAISLPARFTADGMPIGVQIVAKPGNDEGLLRLAALLASEMERPRPWPFRWGAPRAG